MPAPLKKSKKASHKLCISLYIKYIKNHKSIRERQLSRKQENYVCEQAFLRRGNTNDE